MQHLNITFLDRFRMVGVGSTAWQRRFEATLGVGLPVTKLLPEEAVERPDDRVAPRLVDDMNDRTDLLA